MVEWFRLFVGDVSNDVNERTLDEAFNKYPSYCKCKVVRDRLSEKVRLSSTLPRLPHCTFSSSPLTQSRPSMVSSHSKIRKISFELGKKMTVRICPFFTFLQFEPIFLPLDQDITLTYVVSREIYR